MKNNEYTKLERAKQRIAQLRGFYNHLAVYLIVNTVLLLLRGKMTFILLSKQVFGSPEILDNIDWDVFGTPIVWGIALVLHAVSVFGQPYFFGQGWEKRKIEQFMSQDKNQN